MPIAVVAAFAALASIWLARDTASKELRAYVAVVEGKVIWGKEETTVKLTIRNSGQTPADETRIKLTRFGLFTYPSPDQAIPATVRNLIPKMAMQVKENVPYQLASGETFSLKNTLPITDAISPALVEKGLAIYAEGVVNYVDIFEKSHSERFYLIQGGPYEMNAKTMGINLSAQKVFDLPKNRR